MTEKAVKKSRVVSVLERSDEPLSCNKIADRLGVDWHTAKDRIDSLLEKDRIRRRRINSNLVLYSDTEVRL